MLTILSEHQNFEESTEEIAPLTEEEKAARLQELREKLAAKRAGQSEQDKKDKERNDQIRRKATKEQQDIKEDLAKKEQIKEAEAKRREKQADVEAKKRIQAKPLARSLVFKSPSLSRTSPGRCTIVRTLARH